MNFIEKLPLLLLILNAKALTAHSRDWWKYTTIYEVYIWSFKDSNGDGIGDLKGITSKLDHFVDLGVETLWISPFFHTAMKDMGYDVVNYTAIDPMFGTMDDFEELVEKMNERGLKLLIDLVINHSSDQHSWFQKSVDKIEPYSDYYVWRDAKGYDEHGHPLPPNNWKSMFGGSAWKWNEKRKQFYYHLFSENQVDLNFRNTALKSEIKSIIRFWFDKGVAGGRLDSAETFVEDSQFRDQELKNENVKNPGCLDYKLDYTFNLQETYDVIHELREYVDKRYASKRIEKILFPEIYYASLSQTMAYYGTTDYKMTHFPLNVGFVNLEKFPTPKSLDAKIKYWLKNMPSHAVANWNSDNHDNSRTGSRLGPPFRDIMVITMLTLPGIACIYYGQEIGMMDYKVRPDQIRDPQLKDIHLRDPVRLPMQWDDSINAGFSSNPKTWLPVNPNYFVINVEYQKKFNTSRYHIFKELSKLRKTKTLMHGDFKSYIISSWVYAFSRSLADEPTYITILNLGTETEMIHLHNIIPRLPAVVNVRVVSKNSGYAPGDQLYTHPKYPKILILRPMSAMVVSTS